MLPIIHSPVKVCHAALDDLVAYGHPTHLRTHRTQPYAVLPDRPIVRRPRVPDVTPSRPATGRRRVLTAAAAAVLASLLGLGAVVGVGGLGGAHGPASGAGQGGAQTDVQSWS